MKNPNERVVRSALWANALFSLLCGGTLILFSGATAALSQVLGPMEFALLGASLLPFSLVVGLNARQRPLKRGQVMLISSMDFAWVVATILLGVTWPTLFTAQGWLAAALVALAVGALCWLQLYGLFQTRSENPRTESHRPAA